VSLSGITINAHHTFLCGLPHSAVLSHPKCCVSTHEIRNVLKRIYIEFDFFTQLWHRWTVNIFYLTKYGFYSSHQIRHYCIQLYDYTRFSTSHKKRKEPKLNFCMLKMSTMEDKDYHPQIIFNYSWVLKGMKPVFFGVPVSAYFYPATYTMGTCLLPGGGVWR
jgi:hypothetical protein